MNFQQEKRNSGIRQENVRASQNQPIQSPPRQEIVVSNDKHQGCIERMRLLTQELERMTEALKAKNQDINYLHQELEYAHQSQVSNLQTQNPGGNDDSLQQLQMERQKLEQYKQMKEQQLNELEQDLNRIHKELKDERLQKLDYVNRYEKQCGEVVRLQKELEKKNQQPQNNQEIEQYHQHIDDLTHENDELKAKNNSLQTKVQQQQQQIAILEDQLQSQQQPLAPVTQGPATYQLPQMQYQQQQKQPVQSSYQKVTTYEVKSSGNNKPTEVKQQVVKTVNGKTDVYEYSSSKDPLNPRESFSQRLDQVNLVPQTNIEPRTSQLQNNTSASQLQRGSKYLPETYKKDFNEFKSQTKPVTEYKQTVTTTTNKYSKQY